MRGAISRLLPIVAVVAACSLPLACGGTTPTQQIVDQFLAELALPVRALEGPLANDGSTDPDAALRVGDDEDNRFWRSFTSFELPEARGRTLADATLALYQGIGEGAPYAKLGLLFAERVDLGPSLDAADFGAPSTSMSLGVSDDTPGSFEIDVTPLVQDALARGIPRLDIRLRFGAAVTFDDTADLTRFTSAVVDVDPTSPPPFLHVRWRTMP